jgi:invasion protein IalB
MKVAFRTFRRVFFRGIRVITRMRGARLFDKRVEYAPVQSQTARARNCCAATFIAAKRKAANWKCGARAAVAAVAALDSARPFATQFNDRRVRAAFRRLRALSETMRRIDVKRTMFGAKMTRLRAAKRGKTLRQLVAALLFLGAAAAPAALAQGVVKSKFGDWEIRCEAPAGGGPEQCALVQSVAAEDKANVNLVVIVLRTTDGKSRLLRVVAPLGVLLPNGLGLRIDQADIGRAGFVKCLPTGCVAEVVLDDKLIEQLKSGVTATFVIHQIPEEGIGLPVALNGLKEGLARLP